MGWVRDRRLEWRERVLKENISVRNLVYYHLFMESSFEPECHRRSGFLVPTPLEIKGIQDED